MTPYYYFVLSQVTVTVLLLSYIFGVKSEILKPDCYKTPLILGLLYPLVIIIGIGNLAFEVTTWLIRKLTA